MATGGDQPDVLAGGHDEVIERPCSFCMSRDDTAVESASFCVDCDTSMCGPCSKWHKKMGHQVVPIAQAPAGSRNDAMPLPTERCSEHHRKLIDKYCQEHNQLACDSCVSIHHRNCDEMKYIPKFAKGTKKDNAAQRLLTTTQTQANELKKLSPQQDAILNDLSNAETKSQKSLQDMRDRLMKQVDALVKTDSQKITAVFQSARDAVQSDKNEIEDQTKAVEASNKRLGQNRDDNESQLFVVIKQSESHVEAGKSLLNNLRRSGTVTIPKYVLSSDVEKSLVNAKQLGVVNTTMRAKFRGEYNVRTRHDTSRCFIQDICFLPDASLVLTDFDNKSLKYLDPSFEVIGQMPLHSQPCGVCCTEHNKEVAMTLHIEKEVWIVSVGKTIKKTRSFDVGDFCKGITFRDGLLFVCCGKNESPDAGSIRMFSYSGQLLRTIKPQTAGNALFSSVHYVMCSPDGKKLYVTDRGEGLLILDIESETLLKKYSSKKLQWTAGLCRLDDDNLLVGGFESSYIMQVTGSGREMGKVLDMASGLQKPAPLCYDCVNARLIIGTYSSDTIKVYELQ